MPGHIRRGGVLVVLEHGPPSGLEGAHIIDERRREEAVLERHREPASQRRLADERRVRALAVGAPSETVAPIHVGRRNGAWALREGSANHSCCALGGGG